MKTGKINFSDLLRWYNVTIFDKYQGQVEIYTEDGYWGTLNKAYAKKVIREQGRDYKKLVSSSPAPRF